MAKLSEYFKNLVTSIIGGVPTQNADVGKALDEIDDRLNKTSYTNLFEMLVTMNNKVKLKGQENQSTTNGNKNSALMNMIDVNSDYQDQLYDLFTRRKRYQNYKEMIKKISRLGRAIKVLRSNIISSDSIRNRNLIFKPINEDADYEKEVIEARDIFHHLKIDDHRNLRRTIDSSLKYGDYFAEIASRRDIFKDDKKILLESAAKKEERIKRVSFETSVEHKDTMKEFKFNISLESNGFNTTILESEDANASTLDDLIIIYHRPHNIIKLSLGDMIYGYLIVPENIVKTKLLFQNVNIFDSAEKVHQMSNSLLGMDYVYSQKALARSVDITNNIISFLKKNINEEVVDDNLALKSVVAKLVMSSVFSVGALDSIDTLGENINTIKMANMDFRFVDVSRMQEFAINVDDYDPYGTGILDHVLFDAALLVSDKVTSSIERITKSIERRIINFEVDNRNSVALIQVLKEKFRKKKALFDGGNSFDNIPGMISPFEDYYIPTKDGTPFVNFTTEAPTSQHSANVDDMKFKRDEIVGDLNIPPAYLGLEENIESKATLFLQSILFAIEVIDYQDGYSADFSDLLDKIKRVLGLNTRNVLVSFASPVILSSASELEHINTVAGAKDLLIELGLDKSSIRTRYLPFLNEYFTESAKTKLNLDKLEHGEDGEEGQEGGGF